MNNIIQSPQLPITCYFQLYNMYNMYNKENTSDVFDEFEYKENSPDVFNEFEYKLFNKELNVDQFDLHKLFQDKNKRGLQIIEIYYYIYNKYCERHLICCNYLAKMNNLTGIRMLINYYYYKNDKDKALELCIYYGNKRKNQNKSYCFYKASMIYYEKKQYTNANEMINKAISLNKYYDNYYIIKIQSCLTLTHWPIAFYTLFKYLNLPPIQVVSIKDEIIEIEGEDEIIEIEGEDEITKI